MKRMPGGGYTIIEVLIVLAVTGALLVSVMTLVSGQQRRTEFSTAVRDMESKMQDVFNDVESGYFPNNGTTKCTVNNPSQSRPDIDTTVTSVEQGTNDQCIFLGKAIQFYKENPADLVSKYRIFTIAGKRLDGPPNNVKDVTNIDQAGPEAYYKDGAGVANSLGMGDIRNGLQITDVKYLGSSSSKGIAVLSPIGAGGRAFGETTIAANDGGARLGRLNLSNDNNLEAPAIAAIRQLNSSSIAEAQNGVIICMNEGAGGRWAAVTIGITINPDNTLQSGGQRLSTEAYFDDDAKITLGCSS